MMKNNGVIQAKYSLDVTWLALPILIGLVSSFRLFPTLPTVMQDEYVYSMEARFTPLSDQVFPNYLYSLLYSGTNFCGESFYGCAKGLNTLFFLGTVALVFLIARKLFNVAVGTFIASITALSSIGVNVSYFMPDSMYYFFMTLLIFFALKFSDSPTLVRWITLGGLLGLASLVKPHAILVLPAIMIFVVWISKRNQGKSFYGATLQSLSLFTSFLAVKFGIGFALAGSSGLALFGRSYSGSIANFVGSTSAEGGQVGNSEVGLGAAFSEVFNVFAYQLLGQLAFVLLLAGIPLLLGIRVSLRSLRSREELGQQTVFMLILTLLTFTLIPSVAAFQAMTSFLGEDTATRVISRHYEFLFPLFVIAGFSLSKFVDSKLWSRLLQATVVILASMFSLVWFTRGVRPFFADSSSAVGLTSNRLVFLLLVIIAIAIVIFWAVNPTKGTIGIAWIAVPLFVLASGLLAQETLSSKIGTAKTFFDNAGIAAHEVLSRSPGEDILVVSSVRTQAFTVKFWIDKPNIADLIVPDGTDVSELAEGYRYVVILGNSFFTGESKTLDSGSGYLILTPSSSN